MKSLLLHFLIVIIVTFCCMVSFAEQNATNNTGTSQSDDNSATADSQQSRLVWYLPGFLSEDNPQKDAKDLLGNIYPDAQIEHKAWCQDEKQTLFDKWDASVQLADKTATELAKEILKMDENQRSQLILVGHSLGCRVVIRLLNELQLKKVQIQQAILLGAAIDNDDSQIPQAFNASKETVYSMVNPTDYWLNKYRHKDDSGQYHSALGTGCLLSYDTKRFCEIQTDSSTNHESLFYLGQYARKKFNNQLEQNCIIVPQDEKNIPELINISKNWTVIESCNKWTLQHYVNRGLFKTEYYAIIDNLGFCRAKGSEQAMKLSFDKVKRQLQAGVSDNEQVSQEDFSSITVEQDKKIPQEVGSSKELNWTNEKQYNGWRLQHNTQTTQYRILDPSSKIRAFGRENKMEEAFQEVKLQLLGMEEKVTE